MASSEGVTFRWEAFNRWCDEYADNHNGMKPKVEDVRKWHRENAEKVWPDSNERPSVFLAVSHNKGRRVRGHKTCEYYKRYRAGKAAEQQLAARLQPAALSGRRILAVTAAARKHNTDCVRTLVKRPSPESFAALGLEGQEGDEELPGVGHADKRRRMRSAANGLVDRRPVRPAASARRSSSDGFSKSSSWASGAETSQDNDERDDDCGSGVAEAVQARAARHCAAHPSYLHTRAQTGGAHTGVHITLVRRDADGRTIQVETQPLRGGLHRDFGLQQVNFPYCTFMGQMAHQGLGSGGGGLGRQPCQPLDASGDEDNQGGCDAELHKGAAGVEPDLMQVQTQSHETHRAPNGNCQSSPRGQQQAGCAGIGAAAQGWNWAGQLV
ncbi:hypothetical protein VaNZ11_004670, partial [Volvox africanus]